MFKSNKIKKLLAFSLISSGVLFSEISANAVVNRRNSFGGFDSKKPQPSIRRASSLGDLGGGNGGSLDKVKPFIYYAVPGGLKGMYEPMMTFSGGNPELVFEGTSPTGTKFRIDPNMMRMVVYSYTRMLNTGENTKEYKKITR